MEKWIWATAIAVVSIVGGMVVAWIIIGGVFGHTDVSYPVVHKYFDGHMWQHRGAPVTHYPSQWFKAVWTSVFCAVYVLVVGFAVIVWWDEYL